MRTAASRGRDGGNTAIGAVATVAGLSQQPAKLLISPRGGPPGAEVTVRMTGLPPEVRLAIGLGRLRSGYEVLGNAEADANGDLALTVQVPLAIGPDEIHYFLLFNADRQRQPLAVSDGFHVTGPDGTLRVVGRVTDEGGECIAMRGEAGEMYTLVGETGALTPGDRVAVEGTIASTPGCARGLTIHVRRVQTTP